jgi:hypothetical protein
VYRIKELKKKAKAQQWAVDPLMMMMMMIIIIINNLFTIYIRCEYCWVYDGENERQKFAKSISIT